MSHYSCVKSKIANLDCLLKALKTMGFADHMLEVSKKETLTLKGYAGDDRPQRAHLRIRGAGWGDQHNYVGGASNDLGFERQQDGTYAFHVSEYDLRRYGKSWQDKLMQQYEKEVILQTAEEQGYIVDSIEEDENGELQIHCRTGW